MSASIVRAGFLAAFVSGLLLAATPAGAQGARELVEQSLRRHAPPPNVYQEQTLILSDPLGKHTVRTLRYYARHEAAGTRRLAVIQTPEDLRGMYVLVARDAKGERRGPEAASPFFGSNFTVADFEGEQPEKFNYEMEDGQDLDRISHHVIRAIPKDAEVARETGYGTRRLYLRKDNLFLSRVDSMDRQGRVIRRQTFRDPHPDDKGAWQAGMILTEDLREERRTLIKVDRRVHSADYVPDLVFDRQRVGLR
jgi:hypothetical protein